MVIMGCQSSDSLERVEPWNVPRAGIGVDGEALLELDHYIFSEDQRVHSIHVFQHEELLLDRYYYPYNENMLHDVASITKSITSLAVGHAYDQAVIEDLEEPLDEIFPTEHFHVSPLNRSHASIAELLSMTSGFEYGLHRPFSQLRNNGDDTPLIIKALNMDYAQGLTEVNDWSYNSGNYHLLSGLLSLKRDSSESLAQYTQRSLFQRMGIEEYHWESDDNGLSHGWGDLFMHSIDLVKIGVLVLNNGVWQEERILSEEWIRLSTSVVTDQKEVISVMAEQLNIDQEIPPIAYGMGWWIRPYGDYHFIEARGRGGQIISICREKGSVIVITGDNIDSDTLVNRIFDGLPGDFGSNRFEFNESLWDFLSREYVFQENPQGIQGFRIREINEETLVLEIHINSEPWDLLVSRTDDYAVNWNSLFSQGVEGIAVGVKVLESTPQSLSLELYNISKFEKSILELHFSEAGVQLMLDDLNLLGHQNQ